MAPWIKRVYPESANRPSTKTSAQQAAEPSQCYPGHQTENVQYRAVILSSLLYGCETWTVYRRHLKQLERFHQQAPRSILGIRWQDKVTKTEVFERTNCISIEAMLLKSCLCLTGHVIRMEVHHIPKQLPFGELEQGHRKQGRPRKRYKDTVKVGLKWCKIPINTEDSGHPNCSHGRRECGRLSRPCSCLAAGGASTCLCGAFVSSLSEHVSPEQSWGPTVMASGHSVEFAGSGMFRLQFGCSGGTSPLGVDALLLGLPSLPSSP